MLRARGAQPEGNPSEWTTETDEFSDENEPLTASIQQEEQPKQEVTRGSQDAQSTRDPVTSAPPGESTAYVGTASKWDFSGAGSRPLPSSAPTGPVVDFKEWFSSMLGSVLDWLPWSEPQVNQAHLERLAPFADHTSLKFSHDSASDREVLKRLWRAFNPDGKHPEDVSDEELIHDGWREFGFQNKDPGSDFRAVGVFGIHNLLFLAETYPDHFATFSKGENRYPFAIAGLNITMMLLGLLNITGQKTCFHTTHNNDTHAAKKARKAFIDILVTEADRAHINSSDPDAERQLCRILERVFGLAYCASFKCLDDHWVRTNANPMMFNEVLKYTKTKIDEELSKSKHIEDVLVKVGL